MRPTRQLHSLGPGMNIEARNRETGSRPAPRGALGAPRRLWVGGPQSQVPNP
jgi:hypothetical protein